MASKYGVSLDDLAQANDIPNIHRVIAGTKLTIPPSPAATPTTASASNYASAKMPDALLAHPDRLTLVPTFDKWAKAYKVPADLTKALAWMESGWQNSVVSPVAATGIGQLTPDTVSFVSSQLLKTKLDPKTPDDNIRMSARFISYLLDQTNHDVRMALAAYYQGLGSLHRQGVLPVSQAYIAAILALRPMFA